MALLNSPTLRDVATAAGVAVSTVSYALNGKGRVDAATRERVRGIADHMGYRANRSAQNLRSGRTATIGLMLPTPKELSSAEYLDFDWYGRVAIAVAKTAFQEGHSLLLLPSRKELQGLRRIGMDGVLVVDPIALDPRVNILEKIGIPAVTVGPGGSKQFASWTAPDLVSTTQTLLSHLTERGAADILVLSPGMSSEWTRATTIIYLEWCAAHGTMPRISNVPISSRSTTPAEGLVDGAYTATRDALTSANPPDAILSLIPHCAPAATRAARDLGLSIPGDILIAQEADEPALLISDPPITAVDFFPEEQAAIAVQALLAIIGDHAPTPRIHSRSELRVRASTAHEVRPTNRLTTIS